MFTLPIEQRLDPSVTFFSVRDDGELLGIAALKELDPTHGKIKSMQTAEAAGGAASDVRSSPTSSTSPARAATAG